MQGILFKRFSQNATVLKFFAILLVSFGHFLTHVRPDGFIRNHVWIPVSAALVLFAFTSGYFTAWKHSDSFDFSSFWKKKAMTLGIQYTIINIFLGVLFWYRSEPHIISFHSLLCWLGLKGFLVWFGVETTSPFGAGLWFLTLLLMFYLFFPLIAAACKPKVYSRIFMAIFFVIMAYCDNTIYVGHMLWITMAAFVLGTFFSIHNVSLSLRSCTLISVGAIAAAIVFRFLSLKVPTSWMIFVFSIVTINLMFHFTVPNWLQKLVAPVGGTVLGIYILHTYLFVSPSGIVLVDYIASSLLAIGVALAINYTSKMLTKRFI